MLGTPIRRRSCPVWRGLSLVELLVVIAIIGVLLALLMPAVSAQRETARRTQCASRMRQVGVGLHAYYEAHAAFPSGHVAYLDWGQDGKSWGWGALLLPFIEEHSLSDRLEPTEHSFSEVASDPVRAPYLLTSVDVYRCPSDTGDPLAHRFRSIFVPLEVGDQLAWSDSFGDGSDDDGFVGHVFPPDDDPPDEPMPSPGIFMGVRIAKANYLGSHGSEWKPERQDWGDADFEGNGLFGRNSATRHSEVSDGASNTLAVGERSIHNYAGVWAGGNSWEGCGFRENQMVLGTAFYPINDTPLTTNIDCDGQGAANYSSYHRGGVNFLFADGAVRFLSEQIDTPVFHNLARRDDGETVGDF